MKPMSKHNVFAVILAGGAGTRMRGAGRPKQFLEIAGKPILVHSLERFLENEDFEAVLVPVPDEWMDYTRELLTERGLLGGRTILISGGRDRNETLMNALSFIGEHFSLDEDTIVVTHDSVRPLVSQRIIRENIEAAAKYGACGTAIPVTDTIARSGDGAFITEIPERALLYQQQTPQSFRALLLKRAYESLGEKEKEQLTDACAIFVFGGAPVYIVQGEPSNIKVTYPSDLKVAETLLARGKIIDIAARGGR